MNDETGEEETDQKRSAHLDVVLVMTGSLGEAQQKEETADKERGKVGHEDCPTKKQDVHRGDELRNGVFPFFPSEGHAHISIFDRRTQFGELLAENRVVERVREEDAQRRFPSEIREHEHEIPIPFLRNHEDWRSRKMSERAAHGYIHEEEADGGVSKGGAWIEFS